jgi:hydroxyacylglutathione hydrolase
MLYETFSTKIAALPDATRVYPGHEYMANNLAFTLDREPDNAAAKDLLEELQDQDPNDAKITTLGEERQINTFLRLDSPTVVAGVKERFSDLPDDPDEKSVFLKLRELRNEW